MATPEIVKKKLSQAEKKRVANAIDQHLQERSGETIRSERALRKAAVDVQVLLAERMAECGEMFLDDDEQATLLPIILFNASRRGDTRARRIAHELAHERQRNWVAPALYDADCVLCTDQDNDLARHQIAQLVEKKWG